MIYLSPFLWALAALCGLAVAGWLLSVVKRNVALVDSLWSLFFVLAAWIFWLSLPEAGPRAGLVVGLVTVWGLRLSGHITWRNWGHEEDYRYQAIRARNEPNFVFKSLYLVFLLQAALAWFVSLPLLGAMGGSSAPGWLDAIGVALFGVGLFFESVGDWQLARFKADPANRGRVMDRGLWRYTRHPNYFGDFCVWWGLYLVALSGGAWWSLPAPLLMSFLLLKVSGVSLLEKDIGQRRPGYAEYRRRTPAFFPWVPKPGGPSADNRR